MPLIDPFTWSITWIFSIVVCLFVLLKSKDLVIRVSIIVGFVFAYIGTSLVNIINLSFVGLLGIYMFYFPILIIPFAICVRLLVTGSEKINAWRKQSKQLQPQ
jgi:hypothetical protein